MTSTSIAQIQAIVTDAFDVPLKDITGTSRIRHISWARHAGMYLAREETGTSYPLIGRKFGGFDHTSVHYACNTAIFEHIARCSDFASKFTKARNRIEQLCAANNVR